MASAHQGELPRLFHRLFHGGNAALLSDEELLDRFVEQTKGAEAAFEAIVSRHGPMVLGVCRRVLGEQHAAEDAFQATFLLLVRRAERMRCNETLGPWLHEVARRTALKVRLSECRRHTREQRVAAIASSFASTPEVDDELGSALHEEIDRLPVKHRAPVVLCYLEGLTHEAAAEQLGWPVGTVRGRLARARDQLRARLTRRGLAPTMLLAGSRWEPSILVEVPALMREALLGSAMRRTGVATEVSYLIKQVSEHLFMLKLKLAVATTLAVALLVAGAGLAVGGGREAQPPPPERAKPRVAAENRSEPGELPLPNHAIARLGTSRFHNGDLVHYVFHTPDGKSLISYGWNHVIRVWDESGRVVRNIGTPKIGFQGMALSGEGKTLATMEYPARIRIWDPNTGVELRSSDLLEGDFREQLDYSPDGKRLAVAMHKYDKAKELYVWWIGIWDAATLKQERRIVGEWNNVFDLEFSPDGKTLAVAYGYIGPKPMKANAARAEQSSWMLRRGKN